MPVWRTQGNEKANKFLHPFSHKRLAQQPWTVGSPLQPSAPLSRPAGGPQVLWGFLLTAAARSFPQSHACSFNSSTMLLLSWNCSAKPDRKDFFFTPTQVGNRTEKKKNKNKTKTETAACARALCCWSNARFPRWFHPPLTPRTFTLHMDLCN